MLRRQRPGLAWYGTSWLYEWHATARRPIKKCSAVVPELDLGIDGWGVSSGAESKTRNVSLEESHESVAIRPFLQFVPHVVFCAAPLLVRRGPV